MTGGNLTGGANGRIVQNVFFAKDPDPTIKAGLVSTLAGDVWRDDNLFQKMLLRSRRWRFEPYAVEEDVRAPPRLWMTKDVRRT